MFPNAPLQDAWSLRDPILFSVSSLCVALSLILDIAHLVHFPRPAVRVYQWLTSPFRNFLHLEDLEETSVPMPGARKPPHWKNVAMALLSSFQALLVISRLVLHIYREEYCFNDAVLSFSWVYTAFKLWRRPPSTPLYLLLLFFTMVLTHSVIDILALTSEGSIHLAGLVLSIADIAVPSSLIVLMATLPIETDLPGPNVALGEKAPSSLETMPEDSVTLWQWWTFSFVEPIFRVADKRRLEETDVWSLSPFFKHKNLFLKYLDYKKRHPTHSLIRFLIVSNSLDLVLDIVLELWSAVAVFGCVYSLQEILAALGSTPKELSRAYFFAFVTFVLHLSFAQVDLFQAWHSRRSYERTRGQLFCVIHYKALKRRDVNEAINAQKDGQESRGADLGKIVNLMQGDAYTLSLRFWQASTVFAVTVRLILSLIFLHRVIGYSAYAGVAVVLIAYALNWPLAKANIYITRQSWRAKDARMSGVNELFQNIRFLKLYGWIGLWLKRVLDRRERELRWRVKENICAVLISFIWIWVPSAMALSSFLSYTVVAGGSLTVSKTFTALSLFSFLRSPLLELPEQFFSFLHAYVSLQRINAFLSEEEVPDWASTLSQSSGFGDTKLDRIGFAEATFVWNTPGHLSSPNTPFKLGPLNIDFPLEQLSLITGPTGSGKTALLKALLGELSLVNGLVFVQKKNHLLAYCGQNPWLEHATIRDNIIFGSPRGFDQERYHRVVEACALPRDFNMFDAGDLTEIGEKGVTLSGGQRARVALARALYSEATCILLDDPLAAVDMHTASHIVDHCLNDELMKGRTAILVTHHVSLCLPIASYIVELADGNVLRQGTVKDLQASGELRIVISTEDDTSGIANRSDKCAEKTMNEADATGQDHAHWSDRSLIKGKLVEAEHRAEGRVSLKTYLSYVRAAGWMSWVLTLASMILIRLISVVNDLFLAKWSEAYENLPSEHQYFRAVAQLSLASTFVKTTRPDPLSGLPSPNDDTKPWLLIYLWISLTGAAVTLAYISLGYYASLQASRKLFVAMLTRLVMAPARFFDVTPLGRILNRFSTDMNVVDSTLQQSARSAITGVLEFLASFLFIVAIIPQFAPLAVLIAWLYIRLAPPYVRAARDLRRLESVSLSPAFSGFDELLRGIDHVRAFGMEQRYQETFYRKVDLFQSFDHVYWLVAGWLCWRYDCLGSVVVFLTSVFAVWSGASDGFIALAIVQAGVFAGASRQLVRVLAQLELDFNSVERIGEYLEAPQEAPAIIDEKRPPAYWPSVDGNLIVEDLVVCYAPELPPALNGLTFTVNPREKVGVVGRTGSGKTTLALSLLRLVEPTSGKIILDGVDITAIGLEDLRTKITTVSQDVSLFTGTIKSNLDPFDEHSELECWDALERCHLTRREGRAHHGRITSLETVINPVGSLSAGERQLVALARAILRRSQVIIMDEATSQIDVELDDKIQRTVREELSTAMVITIAHRLRTIIDYDRILVLGPGGRLLEFDTPQNLFKKQDSAFKEMCRRSADWEDLLKSVQGSGAT